MKHSPVLAIVLVAILVPSLALAATASKQDVADRLHFAVDGSNVILTSSGSGATLLHREAAGPDTFDLYGGQRRILRDPDGIPSNGDEYVEGKFEDASGFLPRGLSASPDDWTGVDLTDIPNRWQRSTFNAENLNGNGTGNHAMWAGLESGIDETSGWADAPGYGNNWNEILLFESDEIADPSAGQVVDLDFWFNHDSEPAYDYFFVEYDSAGAWIEVLRIDGTNKDTLSGVFPAPGVRFADVQERAIVYVGDDYGFEDRIRIRFRFYSDGAYADEDGFFVGDGGVQLDDVSITTSAGSVFEDFEGSEPYFVRPEKAPFAGNFASVFTRVNDLDPCAENRTPQLGFIDFGQEPDNGPGTSGLASTGGSLSQQWDYGIPGGWVVNYTGGLDDIALANEVWSPVFEWDLPGTEDDDVELYGAVFEFTVYRHNPLINGIFYNWHVRSAGADGEFDNWQDRSFVFFSNTPSYLRVTNDVTDLMVADPRFVRVAFGVIDLAVTFGFPGSDATPAPLFDDVRFRKYRIDGPVLTTRNIDIANDGFPVGGSIDVSTQAARDALDVRFDMARDISSGDLNVPGDSLIVDVAAVLPATEVASVKMKWALRLNPLFESDVRAAPARPSDTDFQSTVDAYGRTIWTGSVIADSSRTPSGIVVVDRYFADLPDEDFLYPGDILHYYFEAIDTDGRVSTLPRNLDGFGTWTYTGASTFSRTWTVRALPTITDVDGDQPRILVYNDFGRRGAENETAFGFGQLGFDEGRTYDTYTVQGPSSSVGNGIGSAGILNALGDRRGHGANADQLAGYDTIFYMSGNLGSSLLSDGSDDGINDKSPDLQVLTSWKNLPGQRSTIYFGDYVVSATVQDSPGLGSTYVSTVMGASLVSRDVRPSIGGLTAPLVEPTGDVPGFDVEFIAYGGCFGINEFDDIRATGAALQAHRFADPGTVEIFPFPAASVIFDRVVAADRKVDITFPYGFQYVYDDLGRAWPGASARTQLLEEIFDYLGNVTYPPVVTSTPSRREVGIGIHPTPFNPTTLVTFALPRAGVPARVEVFNVRGESVRVLYDGVAELADLQLQWNGTDERGARVASGVYLVKAVTEGYAGTKKAVLVK